MPVQVFNELPSSRSIDAFGPIGVRMHFAAEEEIYAQEEDADLIYQVLEGAVRTSRLLSDGRRQIGDFYYPGELFGMEPGDKHSFSADALGDCTILAAKRSAVRHCGDQRERLEDLIWAATAQELARTQEHLFVLGRRGACEKVASFLMSASKRAKSDLTPLAMSRQDIADYLGLTIETVSRTLTQLQSDGLVRFAGYRNFQVVRPAGLSRLVAA
ncbi:helix-turn-helix domain-containing protein [Phenylobacterium sp. LjRoot164]|uniref:helix-turn-helix domain-containing protein n=1 Tax=unclassified Phenylobacterium TaxID=2640670 RepID=UPI003ECC89B5